MIKPGWREMSIIEAMSMACMEVEKENAISRSQQAAQNHTRYVGADTGTAVDYTQVDDGSAAHEPVPEAWQAHIHGLTIRNEQLSYELRMLRALLSRMPDEDGEAAIADPIQRGIDEVCNHILSGDTTDKQRGPLKRAIERAESGAVGRMPGRALR